MAALRDPFGKIRIKNIYFDIIIISTISTRFKWCASFPPWKSKMSVIQPWKKNFKCAIAKCTNVNAVAIKGDDCYATAQQESGTNGLVSATFVGASISLELRRSASPTAYAIKRVRTMPRSARFAEVARRCHHPRRKESSVAVPRSFPDGAGRKSRRERAFRCAGSEEATRWRRGLVNRRGRHISPIVRERPKECEVLLKRNRVGRVLHKRNTLSCSRHGVSDKMSVGCPTVCPSVYQSYVSTAPEAYLSLLDIYKKITEWIKCNLK